MSFTDMLLCAVALLMIVDLANEIKYKISKRRGNKK